MDYLLVSQYQADFTFIENENWLVDISIPYIAVSSRGMIQALSPTQVLTCHDSCQTCSGPTNNECLTCRPWNSMINSPPDQCQYSCHSECLTCSGPNRNQCLTCAAPLIKSTENTCCHSDCLTCTKPTFDGCLTCPA